MCYYNKKLNALKRNSTCDFDFREGMEGVNSYENSMEGVLEQRSEQSSDRRRFHRYRECDIR